MKNNNIIYILLSVIITCCASIQIENNNYYSILNTEIDNLIGYKKDTIYLRKKTFNSHLKRILNNGSLFGKLEDPYLIKLLSNKKEIEYFIRQLDEPFLIDFRKINSKKVIEYIDPLERKDSKGNVIIDHYYLKVFSSRKYSISRPILSLNNHFSFMVVSSDNNSIQLKAYKKGNNNKWNFYKNLKTPID